MNNRKQSPSVATPVLGARWTPAEARRILDEWAASGESLAAFARRRGTQAQRLSWWKKRLTAAPRVSRPVAPAPLIPVAVRGALHEPPLARLEVGAVAVELRVLDDSAAAFIAALVRALGGAP